VVLALDSLLPVMSDATSFRSSLISRRIEIVGGIPVTFKQYNIVVALRLVMQFHDNREHLTYLMVLIDSVADYTAISESKELTNNIK
jgi:hypothetical protein